MLKFTRVLFELIFLIFALNVLYDHIHRIWLNQSVGWNEAISYEWHIAWLPMIMAIAIVLLVAGFELFAVRNENKDPKRRDAVLAAIAKKFGVIEADIQEQEELLVRKSKKKHKKHTK